MDGLPLIFSMLPPPNARSKEKLYYRTYFRGKPPKIFFPSRKYLGNVCAVKTVKNVCFSFRQQHLRKSISDVNVESGIYEGERSRALLFVRKTTGARVCLASRWRRRPEPFRPGPPFSVLRRGAQRGNAYLFEQRCVKVGFF